MADLTLTYADILTAVQERRFPSSSPFPQWVAGAYTDIWNSGDWTFKGVSRETWYTTADGLVGGSATATPKMPVAFASVLSLIDDQGYPLEELDQWEFERGYTDPTGGPFPTARPYRFMVVNRQIHLYPTPGSAYQFQVSYQRRLATRTGAGAIQAGFFQNTSDLPLWDDHHYAIVLRARILGLRDRSDPTATDLIQEFSALLEAMRAEYEVTAPIGKQAPAWRP